MKNLQNLVGLFGLVAFFSIFMAGCGEGEVSSYTQDDEMKIIDAFNEIEAIDSDEAIKKCKENEECAKKMEEAVAPPPPPPSSSSIAPPSLNSSSSAYPPLSSSSSGPVIVVPPTTSSSSTVTPPGRSSSSVAPPTGNSGGIEGTCAPNPATISKGGQATWTFAKAASVPAQSVLGASFDWTFEGASEATHSASGTGGLNKAVSYAESGQYNATLSINGDAPMAWLPLQVYGSAITGCECTVSTTSPDVNKAEAATWTVTGCASVGAEITGYSWNGEASATTTFSHTFTEKGEEFAPILKVSNNDNTVETVICPTAKAIDSSEPEYELTAQNTKIDLPAGKSTIIMNLPADWHNTTAGTCTFSCNGEGALSGTVDGVAITGSYYGTASIPITSTINSYALAVDLGQAMSCQVGW